MTNRCLYVQSSLLERSCCRLGERFAARAHRLHRANRTTREPQATSDPAAAHRRQLKRCSSGWRARTTQNGGALHSASSDLSDVGADRPFAGVAVDKMRRPGAQRKLYTLGLKTSLGGSTRTGSRSNPRVSARLAIIPFLGPRTDSF